MGRIVLVGAGHAHLGVLRRAGALVRRGHTVVVVAPDDFWYSGLATGVLGGRHPVEADRVDVAALARRAGVESMRDAVVAVDAARRHVRLAGGATLAWDALSLDVGSEVALDVPGGVAHVVPVKPIAGLCALAASLASRWPGAGPRRVVVVGGGPSGAEIAANVAGLARTRRARVAVTLVGRDPRLVPDMPAGAAARLARVLARSGVDVRTGAEAIRVEPDAVVLADGRTLPSDLVLWAAGLRPPVLVRASGLPTDAEGALRVDAHLAAAGCPGVFGGGDCVAFPGGLPRIGVHAVRQAPVLLHNLAAVLDGTPLRVYRPQRFALLVMNLGDGTGLAVRGRWWWHGRTALWLKDWIDRRWLAQAGSPEA